MNTGNVPLTYLGVYPAKAGHDYAAIAGRNFRCCGCRTRWPARHVGKENIMNYATKPIPPQKPPVSLVERPWGSFKQYANNCDCTVSLMTVRPASA